MLGILLSDMKWRLKCKLFAYFLGTIVILPLSLTISQAESLEDKAITFVKNINAIELDSKLPKEPFAIWFSKVVGLNAQIYWETNDCGEQTGTSADIGRDFPLCVEVGAVLLDGRRLVIMIAVGTFKKGVEGKPELFWAFIEHKGHFFTVRPLHKLPKALLISTEK